MLQRAASSAYSWWWASHIRTKQSKWLEQNLQDMEDKVGSMLSIIDEDGDSFAKRAEMYYRKRPELVHLVEESFRAYRGLAERYDHISRDLQSANRTIATVYPEKVHFSSLEDDDEEQGLVKLKPIKLEENNDMSKPPIPKAPAKSFKPLLTFKPRRSQQRQLKRTSSSARAAPCSGLSKGEALEEIDKLQKGILALQTEKEFVKSLYENAVAKYLEIEARVGEMQVQVCGLQDEFGIGSVIEDDEARKLMASTALKSCREMLNRLKEKQENLVKEVSLEQGKIKEAHQMLQAFKDERELGVRNKYQAVIKPDNVTQALQSLEEKMKKLGDVKGNESLTATELVDKIDDVVDVVVNLETAVASSSAAMVERLRSEAVELQEHVQALGKDEDKTVEGSGMVELDAEMVRVQNLSQDVEDLNAGLGAHLTRASYSLDQLEERVENFKFDEMVEIAGWNVAGDEHKMSAGNHLKKGDKFLNVVSQLLSTSSDKPQASNSLDAEKEDHEKIVLGVNGLSMSEERSDELLGVSEGREDNCAIGEPVEMIQNAESGYENIVSSENGLEITAENEEQPVKLVLPEAAGQDNRREDHRSDESFVQHQGKDLEDEKQEKVSEATGRLYKDKEDDEAKQDEKNFQLESVKASTAEPNNTNTGSDSTQEDEEKLKLELDPAIVDGSGTSWGKMVEDSEGESDWRGLFLSGVEDREKFLVDEYTSVIKTLKEARRKLSEVEKKSREGLTEQASKMKQILHANSLKDKEIQSLKLSLMKMSSGVALPGTSRSEQNEEALPKGSELLFSELGQRTANDAVENTVDETQPARLEINLNDEDEPHFVSSLEEKFRSDLDEMLGENLELWLRFCTSVHQIQKFQSSIEDLQIEAARVMESKKQGTNTRNVESLKSDAKPIYMHLKEIQAELSLWLQHNSVLQEELEGRHSSLSDIQEGITRLSNATEDSELSEYQAAKFQGEVANMKQENSKVADELQSCLGRVRILQSDIERTLLRLNEELGIGEEERKRSGGRIPLRTFLFGVRLRKQKQSFFRCISPALQKQYSDLASHFPPPR